MNRRSSLTLIGATIAATLTESRFSFGQSKRRPPNIVVVVIDDLRYDETGIGGHPYLKTPAIDRIAKEGATFSQAIHATPLCSPNRACLLTGQYTATHGVYGNADRSALSHILPTFPREAQAAGYKTAFVGKWHMGNDPTPRPGFDYWVSFPGQGRTMNPDLYEDGRLHKVTGHVTDILTERAVTFLAAQKESSRPFLLYLAHKAVHPDAVQRDDGSIDLAYPMQYIPAERHRGAYSNSQFTRPRRTSTVGLGSKMVEKFLARKTSKEIAEKFGTILDPGTSEQTIQSRAEMMLSVDESVSAVYTQLDKMKQLDDTVFVFTSDNGYFFGEHGLSIERRLPYEDSIRAPLLIRYPPLIAAGRSISDLVSSVDLAPTLLDLAGVKPSPHSQGLSFARALADPDPHRKPGRSAVLIENFSDDQPMPWLFDADYKSIRTDHHKFIHWVRYPELDELYDLKDDPLERHNRINDKSLGETVIKLRAELASLVRTSISL